MSSNYSVQERTAPYEEAAPQARINYSRLWWAGLIAAVTAAVANLIILVVAQVLLGLPLMVPAAPGSPEMAPLSAAAVIITSVVPAIVATLLLAILGKFLKHPIRAFWIAAVVFLLISFIGPLTLPVGIATKAILTLMHLVAAAVIIGVLTSLSQSRAQD